MPSKTEMIRRLQMSNLLSNIIGNPLALRVKAGKDLRNIKLDLSINRKRVVPYITGNIGTILATEALKNNRKLDLGTKSLLYGTAIGQIASGVRRAGAVRKAIKNKKTGRALTHTLAGLAELNRGLNTALLTREADRVAKQSRFTDLLQRMRENILRTKAHISSPGKVYYTNASPISSAAAMTLPGYMDYIRVLPTLATRADMFLGNTKRSLLRTIQSRDLNKGLKEFTTNYKRNNAILSNMLKDIRAHRPFVHTAKDVPLTVMLHEVGHLKDYHKQPLKSLASFLARTQSSRSDILGNLSRLEILRSETAATRHAMKQLGKYDPVTSQAYNTYLYNLWR